jgi:hypothetical protein
MIIGVVSIFFVALVCYAAYNHQGDSDSAIFRAAYPGAVGTKLDSCATCHRGSSKPQDPVTLGSCQWCHYVTNYDANSTPENLLKTLNAYGLAYKNAGRNAAALQAISGDDSDGDLLYQWGRNRPDVSVTRMTTRIRCRRLPRIS